MDPLTQGTLGGILPQSVVKDKKLMKIATVLGFLGGMAPDLDVFIKSSTDPLLFLEFHRHFTHSLVFIPIGGLICSFILFQIYFKRKISFKNTYKFTTLGYATHALLDSCTSYGTQLFWPFTNYRVSWNNISIIDPLFTLPILLLMIISFKRRTPTAARAAVIYGLSYLLLGFFQNYRAVQVSTLHAIERGHISASPTAKPSFGNLLLWKTIYEYKGHFYVDAARVGLSGNKFYSGSSIKKFEKKDLPFIKKGSTLERDIERFRWFSNDYLALSPKHENTIIDMRYSSLPHQIEGLWGITLNPNEQDKHVGYRSFRENPKERLKTLWLMVKGKDISKN